MRINILTLALLFTSMTGLAQVPVDQLAKPPADAQPYTILSTAGTHGKAFIWTTPDGSQWSRESILLRGQVWEMDQSIKLGADGMPSALVVRGVTPQGDAAETFTITDGIASWKSPVDSGHQPYHSAFYVAEGGTNSGGTQVFMEALLKSPDKSMPLLPGGRARAEKLTDHTVGSGPTAKIVTLWAVTGLLPSPQPVWMTADANSSVLLAACHSCPWATKATSSLSTGRRMTRLRRAAPDWSRPCSKHHRTRLLHACSRLRRWQSLCGRPDDRCGQGRDHACWSCSLRISTKRCADL